MRERGTPAAAGTWGGGKTGRELTTTCKAPEADNPKPTAPPQRKQADEKTSKIAGATWARGGKHLLDTDGHIIIQIIHHIVPILSMRRFEINVLKKCNQKLKI